MNANGNAANRKQYQPSTTRSPLKLTPFTSKSKHSRVNSSSITIVFSVPPGANHSHNTRIKLRGANQAHQGWRGVQATRMCHKTDTRGQVGGDQGTHEGTQTRVHYCPFLTRESRVSRAKTRRRAVGGLKRGNKIRTPDGFCRRESIYVATAGGGT